MSNCISSLAVYTANDNYTILISATGSVLRWYQSSTWVLYVVKLLILKLNFFTVLIFRVSDHTEIIYSHNKYILDAAISMDTHYKSTNQLSRTYIVRNKLWLRPSSYIFELNIYTTEKIKIKTEGKSWVSRLVPGLL